MDEKGKAASGVMTVPEVAAYLRISRNLAYQLCREGRIPTIRLGDRVLIPRQGVERMLSEGGEISARSEVCK